MNGAEALVSTLVAGGIEVCFTNPGTSEMHLVAALARAPELQSVLGLFEGVATGAADGYARMSGKPACTLLHLGPGLANSLANLHNASRAHTPIVNIVGQHPSYHLQYDAPLTSDIEGIAKPYSKWLRTSSSVCEISRDASDAIVGARTAPGQIATLIVPSDVAWTEGATTAKLSRFPKPIMADSHSIDRAAEMLRSGLPTAILMTGPALYGKGLSLAGVIAGGTGAKLLAPYAFPRMERGTDTPLVERIHYISEQATDQLRRFRQLILVGAAVPVSYFAYPGKNSVLTEPDCRIHVLARPEQDCTAALDALAEALSLRGRSSIQNLEPRPTVPDGEISLLGLATTVGALLPENTIVVDESMTSGRGMMAATRGAPRHDWLVNTGGSIGIAMPLAVGAAVACPDRRVLCLSADGSGMYTLQALWTMAREGLKVTTVVFANRAYGVLKREFSNFGLGEPNCRTLDLFEIGRPDLDWVQLANGMGVPGARVDSLTAFAKALSVGFASDGPMLIEVPL